jgi:hypothetical protein
MKMTSQKLMMTMTTAKKMMKIVKTKELSRRQNRARTFFWMASTPSKKSLTTEFSVSVFFCASQVFINLTN